MVNISQAPNISPATASILVAATMAALTSAIRQFDRCRHPAPSITSPGRGGRLDARAGDYPRAGGRGRSIDLPGEGPPGLGLSVPAGDVVEVPHRPDLAGRGA